MTDFPAFKNSMIEQENIQIESKTRQKALRPSSWLFILILLLGAWLRLDVTIKTTVDSPLRADALGYFSYAYNLRHYGVYSRDYRFVKENSNAQPKPDALSSPGYPLFLMPFTGQLPTDKTILHITLLQALLGSIVILFTYITAKQFLGGNWALLPSFLVAISPQLVNCGVYVLSESLFTFLMMAAITCLAVQTKFSRNLWLTLLSGLLLGAAALTRPTLNYIVPFLLLALLPYFEKSFRWKWAVTLTTGFVLVMLPWMLRNWLTLGGSDPTLVISTLVHGHYPWAMYEGNPQSLGYPYRFDPEIEQLSKNISAALQGISRRIMTDPFTYLTWYIIGKPIMFFSWGDVASAGEFFTYPTPASPYYNSLIFQISRYIMWITHYIWIILAAISVFLLLCNWKKSTIQKDKYTPRLLGVFFIYFALVHMVGFPLSRYSLPLLPLIFMLATYSIRRLLNWCRLRTSLQAIVLTTVPSD